MSVPQSQSGSIPVPLPRPPRARPTILGTDVIPSTDIAVASSDEPSSDAAVLVWRPSAATMWWSPEQYELFGYPSGDVSASMELVLQHTRPQDQDRLQKLIQRTVNHGEGFTFDYQVVDTAGRARPVLTIGQPVADRRGQGAMQATTVSVQGFTRAVSGVDEDELPLLHHRITQLQTALQTRDLIGQAKGIISAAMRITPDQSFSMLVYVSQHRNEKLNVVAQFVVDTGTLPAFDTGAGHPGSPHRRSDART